MAQNDFVDLYEVLQIAPDADVATLQNRIREKYLEAQQNLDHRDAQKRLGFQQLYEVYLPQARHLLLDEAHRAEYDRYLQAFRSGQAVAPATQASGAAQTPVASSDGLEAMDNAKVDPQQLAAQRENLWDQWKSGLEATPAPPASTRAPSSSAATPTAPAPQQRRPKKQWKSRSDPEEAARRLQESEERQRQRDHIQMALDQAEAARKPYTLGFGLGFLVLLPIYWFAVRGAISAPVKNFMPNGGTLVLQFIIPFVIALGAFFVSQWASDFGYARVLKKHNVKPPSPGDRLGL